MESVQNDALANMILGKLKKGPLSLSDISKDFQRFGQDMVDSTLAKLHHTKQITRETERTKGRPKNGLAPAEQGRPRKNQGPRKTRGLLVTAVSQFDNRKIYSVRGWVLGNH